MKQITKYVCEHCNREYRRKTNAEKHESICYKNKENKTCLTCKYYDGLESLNDGPYFWESIVCTHLDCENVEDNKPVQKCECWKEDTRTKEERKNEIMKRIEF